jgi:MinD-like ATPase involved in chromosome partitioning or flagellar assembly
MADAIPVSAGTTQHDGGRVVTFYSYKGGTGRSMALANVAWLLALDGRRVLTIDWDLEAPGLHRYFHPFMDDPSQTGTEGLLDFAMHVADVAAADEALETRNEDFFFQHARLDTFIEPLDCDFLPEGAELGFIGPGRQGPAYGQQLGLFNWHQFYSKLRGRQFIDAALRRLRSHYDYILIDSRTGVSDTAGICTVHVPDVLVVCFTLNDQSILGASAIAEYVRSQRAADESARNFRVLPVASRVEVVSEHDKRQTALDYAKQAFGPCLGRMSAAERETYWGQTQLVYLPFYAFEEIPAVFGDDPRAEFSLTTSIRRLASYVVGGGGVREAQLEPSKRKALLQRYLRRADRNLVMAAEALVDRTPDQQVGALRSVLLRLVRVEEGVPHGLRRVPAASLPTATEVALRELQQAGVVHVTRDGRGDDHVLLSDASLIDNWPRLAEWIRADAEFIRRRQDLEAAAEAWVRAGRDDSALLRGPLLDDAERLVAERGIDLNHREQQFVAASDTARARIDAEAEANHTLSLMHTRLLSLSTAGVTLTILLLPLVLYTVFGVSLATLDTVRRLAADRAVAQQLVERARALQGMPVAIASPPPLRRALRPAQSADEYTRLRRVRREEGKLILLSRTSSVAAAGVPGSAPLPLEQALLIAAIVGTGIPALLILVIVMWRELLARRAARPVRDMLDNTGEQPWINLVRVLVRRTDAMVAKYLYSDPLGTAVGGTQALVASIALLSVASLAVYVLVVAYVTWRATGGPVLAITVPALLTALAVAAALIYPWAGRSFPRTRARAVALQNAS